MSVIEEILAKQDEILAELAEIRLRLDELSGHDEWPDEDSPETVEAMAALAEEALADPYRVTLDDYERQRGLG